MPDSVFDLTDPTWKGKIGIAPTNASFQAFVTAMRLSAGEAATRQWLVDLKQNDPKTYEKNTPIVEALATGEIELGLVNHYYLYLVKEEQPDAPIANHFLAQGDPGALVSVAGAGVLASSGNKDEAEQFVDFLLSDEGQRFYTDTAEEAEYPLVAGIPAKDGPAAARHARGAGRRPEHVRRRARVDARAAPRDRLPVVSRRAGGRRPPLPLVLAAGVVVCLLLLPLAYLADPGRERRRAGRSTCCGTRRRCGSSSARCCSSSAS